RVDLRHAPRAVRDPDHRAALIGDEPPAVARPRAFVPDERLVDAGAVDVATEEGARGVVLGDHVGAVVEEPGRGRARDLVQPPGRIVAEADAARGPDQAVVEVVGVALRAVVREVAAGVVGGRGAPGT